MVESQKDEGEEDAEVDALYSVWIERVVIKCRLVCRFTRWSPIKDEKTQKEHRWWHVLKIPGGQS